MTKLLTPLPAQTIPRRDPRTSASRQLTRHAKWTRGLSLGYLVVSVLLMALLYEVSEAWWVSATLTYLPRTPYLLPALILIGCAIAWDRKSILTNALTLVVLAGPVMGLSLGSGASPLGTGTKLRVFSCNVQVFEPDFDVILDEIARSDPDVVCLQEVNGGDPRLDAYFADWETVEHEEFFIASKYPILDSRPVIAETYNRPAALIATINTPSSPVRVATLHLMTARHGLSEVNAGSVRSGEAREILDLSTTLRDAESLEVRAAIESASGSVPTVIAGDFNMPPSSSLFRSSWTGFQNAFDVAGVGYGYTSPVAEHRLWLSRTPWLRIDHILCSPEVRPLRCEVSERTGSDHYPLWADLKLPPAL